MGIFGDQAERLLRKSWASPTELAQELYSIFAAKGPIQVDSPIRVTTDTPEAAISITNHFGGDGNGLSLNINGGTITNGPTVYGGSVYTYAPGDITNGGNVQNIWFPANGPLTSTNSYSSNPTFDVVNNYTTENSTGGPLGKGPDSSPGKDAPIIDKEIDKDEKPTDSTSVGSGGSGGSSSSAVTGLVGIIQSGSGSKYSVALYPRGFGGSVGEVVDVNIPNIDPGEKIDVGTKIVGVIGCVQVDATATKGPVVIYYYQPAVWTN